MENSEQVLKAGLPGSSRANVAGNDDGRMEGEYVRQYATPTPMGLLDEMQPLLTR